MVIHKTVSILFLGLQSSTDCIESFWKESGINLLFFRNPTINYRTISFLYFFDNFRHFSSQSVQLSLYPEHSPERHLILSMTKINPVAITIYATMRRKSSLIWTGQVSIPVPVIHDPIRSLYKMWWIKGISARSHIYKIFFGRVLPPIWFSPSK